jgi:hypothetical protein
MGLKTIQSVSGEVSTSDDNWTTIATYTVGSDCSIRITEIFALGRTTSGTIGEVAYGEAIHRGKRVSGVLSLVKTIIFIMTFNTGSDSSLTTCLFQILVSGNNLLLQVKGVAGRDIDWYGGFTVTLN